MTVTWKRFSSFLLISKYLPDMLISLVSVAALAVIADACTWSYSSYAVGSRSGVAWCCLTSQNSSAVYTYAVRNSNNKGFGVAVGWQDGAVCEYKGNGDGGTTGYQKYTNYGSSTGRIPASTGETMVFISVFCSGIVAGCNFDLQLQLSVFQEEQINSTGLVSKVYSTVD